MNYIGESKEQVENQNELFRLATGLDENVFTAVSIKDVGHKGLNVVKQSVGNYSYQYNKPEDGSDDCYVKYNYTVPDDGPVYAYFSLIIPTVFKLKRTA